MIWERFGGGKGRGAGTRRSAAERGANREQALSKHIRGSGHSNPATLPNHTATHRPGRSSCELERGAVPGPHGSASATSRHLGLDPSHCAHCYRLDIATAPPHANRGRSRRPAPHHPTTHTTEQQQPEIERANEIRLACRRTFVSMLLMYTLRTLFLYNLSIATSCSRVLHV